jgi:hypothetical protein
VDWDDPRPEALIREESHRDTVAGAATALFWPEASTRTPSNVALYLAGRVGDRGAGDVIDEGFRPLD